ncbi:MAG: hypothetical protein R3176_06815 [Woeseiaceae bacterium]|nr:hypothetical protein [Woeseiaceae bacterium]
MGDGARTLGEIGDDLVHRPGVLPGKAHGWFRTWCKRVWQVRGGGLYALGYVVAFVYLEITTIVDDVLDAESVIGFFTAELIEFLFRFLSESLVNFVLALIWPVFVLQYRAPWGALALGAAFLAFPRLIKKPVERWLFGAPLAADSETGPRPDGE